MTDGVQRICAPCNIAVHSNNSHNMDLYKRSIHACVNIHTPKDSKKDRDEPFTSVKKRLDTTCFLLIHQLSVHVALIQMKVDTEPFIGFLCIKKSTKHQSHMTVIGIGYAADADRVLDGRSTSQASQVQKPFENSVHSVRQLQLLVGVHIIVHLQAFMDTHFRSPIGKHHGFAPQLKQQTRFHKGNGSLIVPFQVWVFRQVLSRRTSSLA